MSNPRARVGILSIGSMGYGIAKILVAHNYRVLTNVSHRSPTTRARAQEAELELCTSDEELVAQCDYILSIVPPKDATATADRIVAALKSLPTPRDSSSPMYYLELNAISPQTSSIISKNFKQQAPHVRFIDGGIIGNPPSQAPDSTWKQPGIPLSGPHPLHSAPINGAHLASTLNTNYLSPNIGSASGLKCCFSALSKGVTALALQSFSTASSLDVLPALEQYLEEYNPQIVDRVNKGIVGCPSKAYRWVEEMRQIGECFGEEGGWREQAKVFREIAGVYQGLANAVERNGGTRGMGDVGGVVGALKEELGESGYGTKGI